TLTNTGDETVTVTGAKTDIADHAMLHGMKTLEDGSKKMFHLHHLAIAAGEAVSLAPGGNHLMLMQLERVPAEGEEVEVCFLVKKGEPACTVFPVKRSSPSDS
ncbi:MAG: copper chaperone PCu(A)C, partial [Pseudomonadales bacterium]|nr:copper chaperone PCu(A)C [Pseudomonadales bacterium]